LSWEFRNFIPTLYPFLLFLISFSLVTTILFFFSNSLFVPFCHSLLVPFHLHCYFWFRSLSWFVSFQGILACIFPGKSVLPFWPLMMSSMTLFRFLFYFFDTLRTIACCYSSSSFSSGVFYASQLLLILVVSLIYLYPLVLVFLSFQHPHHIFPMMNRHSFLHFDYLTHSRSSFYSDLWVIACHHV